MIITVTLNPAIDKTAAITKKVKAGGLNRLAHTVQDAGGKGINVSKTIHALGGHSVAVGFLGRTGSERILECLEKEEIEQDFILVDGETRTNLKIMDMDGELTEFNEAGPDITDEQVKALLQKLEAYACAENVFVFAGNVPKGVDVSIYQTMIKVVKQKGARAFLDADGELFRNGIQECPYMIKPNEVEAAQYFGQKEKPTMEQLITYGKKFLDMGIEQIMISMGKEGALFFRESKTILCKPLNVLVCSTVGAGDAMVAAAAYAMEQGLCFEETIRLAMAASAGAVMTEGTKPPSLELVQKLKGQVVLEQV